MYVHALNYRNNVAFENLKADSDSSLKFTLQVDSTNRSFSLGHAWEVPKTYMQQDESWMGA